MAFHAVAVTGCCLGADKVRIVEPVGTWIAHFVVEDRVVRADFFGGDGSSAGSTREGAGSEQGQLFVIRVPAARAAVLSWDPLRAAVACGVGVAVVIRAFSRRRFRTLAAGNWTGGQQFRLVLALVSVLRSGCRAIQAGVGPIVTRISLFVPEDRVVFAHEFCVCRRCAGPARRAAGVEQGLLVGLGVPAGRADVCLRRPVIAGEAFRVGKAVVVFAARWRRRRGRRRRTGLRQLVRAVGAVVDPEAAEVAPLLVVANAKVFADGVADAKKLFERTVAWSPTASPSM